MKVFDVLLILFLLQQYQILESMKRTNWSSLCADESALYLHFSKHPPNSIYTFQNIHQNVFKLFHYGLVKEHGRR